MLAGPTEYQVVGAANKSLRLTGMKREPPAADAMPTRVQEKPSWLITRVNAHAHRLLADGFAAAGARGYHYRLLAALDEFGPASQAALGRRTSIDRSDVVAALNELSERGLIERAPDPDDRRRNVITITAAGTKELRKLDKVLDGIQEKLLAALSPADREQLVRLLTTVLEHDA
jgi:DNA-binding MarR family transcriptional regulator